MSARVIVLAGPSGSGKSHLAERLGLPVLRLDDFYKDGDDPTLPRLDLAGGEPIVDWDDPGSWNADAAVAAVEELCRTGCTDAPVYDISTSAAHRSPGARPGRLGVLRGRGHLRPGDRRRVPAPRSCWPTPSASPSTRSSPSYAASPATCASTASRRSCWYGAGCTCSWPSGPWSRTLRSSAAGC